MNPQPLKPDTGEVDVAGILEKLLHDLRSHRALLLSPFVLGFMIPLSPITAYVPNLEPIKIFGYIPVMWIVFGLWLAGMVYMFRGFRCLVHGFRDTDQISIIQAALDLKKEPSNAVDPDGPYVRAIEQAQGEITNIESDTQEIKRASKLISVAVALFITCVSLEFFAYTVLGKYKNEITIKSSQ